MNDVLKIVGCFDDGNFPTLINDCDGWVHMYKIIRRFYENVLHGFFFWNNVRWTLLTFEVYITLVNHLFWEFFLLRDRPVLFSSPFNSVNGSRKFYSLRKSFGDFVYERKRKDKRQDFLYILTNFKNKVVWTWFCLNL